MDKAKIIFLCFLGFLLTLTVSLWLFVYISIYPQYLIFIPKISFENDFFAISLTSWIHHFWIGETDIVAYYGVLGFEENFEGDWELEHFISNVILCENETQTIVETHSQLMTYKIHKLWTFFRNKPYFMVELTRTYTLNSRNMNNQLIIDIENDYFVSDNSTFVTYYMGNSSVMYQILEAQPNNVTIQTSHPTETQINFYGLADRDYRFHSIGEIEYVKVRFQLGEIEA